ncbi:MAG: FHA domain-containing protein [Spirochaetales bacterium]|nr:FHA domain-containing protein [Spirochaetales bacterium]
MEKASTIINPEDGKIRPGGVLANRGLLVVLSESQFGSSFVLTKGRSVIGRSGSCDIVLEDPLISREHCVIESDGDGGYWLEDLGSKNATVLNRKAVSRRAALCYGDRIVVGDTVLRFFLEERVERK